MLFDVATEIVVARAKKTQYMREWRAANPERARAIGRENMRRQRQNHPERVKANKRSWYWANVERERAKSTSWAKQNPEKANARTRQWRQANRERHLAQVRIYQDTRRALKQEAPGSHTVEDVSARFAVHGNACIYCGTTDDLSTDHLIPLSRGGSEWPANLAPACLTCNKSKGTRTYFEFMAARAA